MTSTDHADQAIEAAAKENGACSRVTSVTITYTYSDGAAQDTRIDFEPDADNGPAVMLVQNPGRSDQDMVFLHRPDWEEVKDQVDGFFDNE